jgi:hypothetical protein
MKPGHQFIIDCGVNNNLSCQLNDKSLDKISIKAHAAPARYKYYFLINNHFQQNCQVNLRAFSKNQEKDALWSEINLKIFYQNTQLFADNLLSFFSKEIDLLFLERNASKLYRFELDLAEFSDNFEIIFDLNFFLNCYEKQPENLENKVEVLAAKTEFVSEIANQPSEKLKGSFFQEYSLLIIFLISFILSCLIVFLFWRLRIEKSKQILISSKKGKIYEQKEKH